MSGHPVSVITEECQAFMDKLDWLRVSGEVMPYEILSKTVELFNSQHDERHLSIEKLISGLAVRRKVCKLVYEGHINDQVLTALDDIASGR